MTYTPGSPVGPDHDRGIATLALSLGSVVLRNRFLFVGFGAVFFAILVLPKLFQARSYSAEASFVPSERPQTNSGIATLAAQFGVSVASGSAAESPAFYSALVNSRGILSEVVLNQYDVATRNAQRGTLIELWDVPGSTQEARVEEAVRWLREAMSTSITRETGAVRITVTSAYPRLAAGIAQQLIDQVNNFNVNRRQSQAGAERRFVSQRMEQARVELAEAENQLQAFLQRNRQVSNAPHLQFENDRLQRIVTLRSQIYTSLAQSFEQARISEARDLPVITVIDRPVEPASPNRRGLIWRGLRGLALGAAVALLVALIREFFRTARVRNEDELLDLTLLWRDTREDVRHPIRALRRVPAAIGGAAAKQPVAAGQRHLES